MNLLKTLIQIITRAEKKIDKKIDDFDTQIQAEELSIDQYESMQIWEPEFVEER